MIKLKEKEIINIGGAVELNNTNTDQDNDNIMKVITCCFAIGTVYMMYKTCHYYNAAYTWENKGDE